MIDTVGKTVQYIQRGSTINCDFIEIIDLERYTSFGAGTGYYSLAEYEFYRILYQGNKKIIVTTLMMNSKNKHLELILQIKAKRVLKVACFLPPLGKYRKLNSE